MKIQKSISKVKTLELYNASSQSVQVEKLGLQFYKWCPLKKLIKTSKYEKDNNRADR